MYESPIKAFAKSVSDKYEDGVVRIVQQYGFDVNKEELAKALAYDRHQYELGYKDGKDDAAKSGGSGTEETCDTGEISDGYHTFNELYHHRAILFSVICNTHPDLAWKSLKHDNPEEPMYDGMFIVGIETPEGQATYHYDINPYWDMFRVKELEKAPKWDGHTPAQAIERIFSLGTEPVRLHGHWEYNIDPSTGLVGQAYCSICGEVSMDGCDVDAFYCPHCGAKMDKE